MRYSSLMIKLSSLFNTIVIGLFSLTNSTGNNKLESPIVADCSLLDKALENNQSNTEIIKEFLNSKNIKITATFDEDGRICGGCCQGGTGKPG